jgi:hypothetical protein
LIFYLLQSGIGAARRADAGHTFGEPPCCHPISAEAAVLSIMREGDPAGGATTLQRFGKTTSHSDPCGDLGLDPTPSSRALAVMQSAEARIYRSRSIRPSSNLGRNRLMRAGPARHIACRIDRLLRQAR